MISRTIKFLKQYVLKHPLYVTVYAWGFFSRTFTHHIYFYSEQEVQQFLREGKSLIRLGDGEVNILLDLNNHYHTFSSRIQKMLKEIISSYSRNSSYVLSVPYFLNIPNTELKKMNQFNVWMPFKTMFLLLFPKKNRYMDAHNFYRDDYFERVIAPVFLNKTLVIITNKKTIEKQRTNTKLPWKDIRYVETPEENALDAYDGVKASLDRELSSCKRESTVLFFALGPVGKYMLKEYAEQGYQGLDTGKVTEVMFTGESIEWMI